MPESPQPLTTPATPTGVLQLVEVVEPPDLRGWVHERALRIAERHDVQAEAASTTG